MDISDLIKMLNELGLGLVKHVMGTKEQYDSLSVKDDSTLYFVTDEGSIYKGTNLFGGQKDAYILKGKLGKSNDGGTVESLPTSNYKKGWTYIVVSDLESPLSLKKDDLIIAVNDYDPKNGTTFKATDWFVVKASADNAVTSDDTLTANSLILGDGDKKVKPLANGTNNQFLAMLDGMPAWKYSNIIAKEVTGQANLYNVKIFTCKEGNSGRLYLNLNYEIENVEYNKNITLDFSIDKDGFKYMLSSNGTESKITKVKCWNKDGEYIVGIYCDNINANLTAVLETLLNTENVTLPVTKFTAEEMADLDTWVLLEIPINAGVQSNMPFVAEQFVGTATKVSNKLTVGDKQYDGSEPIEISAGDLGLSAAMKYLGTTTSAIEDGSTENPIYIGKDLITVSQGAVVISGDKEFLWNGTSWEELGSASSFKKKQTAVSDPASSGDSSNYEFISNITQDEEGKITPTKKKIPTAGTNKLGMVKTTDSRTSVPQGYEAVPIVGGVPYVNTAYLPTRGGTMAGDINMNGNKMTNVSIEPVESLPTENLYEGRQVTYQGRIYTYHNNEWASVADDLGGRPETHPEEFLYQPTASDLSIKDGFAKIKSIKGNTIVWNQLADVASWIANKDYVIGFSNLTFAGGILTLSTTTAGNYKRVGAFLDADFKGHKMLLSCQAKCNIANYAAVEPSKGLGFRSGYHSLDGYFVSLNGMNTSWKKFSRIFSMPQTTDYKTPGIVLNVSQEQLDEAGGTLTFEFKDVNAFDLTQMFGEGNEPATVEEFEAMFPASNYEYNAGELLSHDSTGIKTVGFNQWDEVPVLGDIIFSNGSDVSSDETYRTNYIRVFPDTSYYAKLPQSILQSSNCKLFEYDINKKFIKLTKTLNAQNGTSFKTLAGTHYIRIRFAKESYNNDICINLSHTGVRNGEYQPYEEYVNKWSGGKKISELTSNGEVVFPNGLMGGAGDAYDEITKDAQGRSIAIKRVTIAEDRLSLQSLATPITYVLDDDISFEYKVWDFGTEEVITNGLTTPIKADIEYGFNAVDMIRNNYFEIGNIKKSYLPVNGTAANALRLGGCPMVDELPDEPTKDPESELGTIPTSKAVRNAIKDTATDILNLLTWGTLE